MGMQRFLESSHSIALSGIMHASPVRLGVLHSSRRILACPPGVDLRLQRYARQMQAAQLAHLALRRAALTLRWAWTTWADTTHAACAEQALQFKNRQTVGTLLLRVMQTSSQALELGRKMLGLSQWHTYTVSVQHARASRFQQALAVARMNYGRRLRHAMQLAFCHLRTYGSLRRVAFTGANQCFVLEEKRRIEQWRLVGTILGHYMYSTSAELYTYRVSWGFGVWQASVAATQKYRHASFGGHLSAFVQHSRRLAMQWGFRRWLVWTWQDRYQLLNQQFGLCQNALADLENDVKRLENENAALENSRASAIVERDSLRHSALSLSSPSSQHMTGNDIEALTQN